jgi:eukaryotic-like serine/threonine-protein kinase
VEGALAAYNASLAIAEKLAKSNPGNIDWQETLSDAHANIGDVLLTQGKLVEALAAYKASLAIADRLAISDPGNVGRQNDSASRTTRLATCSLFRTTL